jgi:uncharacterized protein (TIGR03382 family)
VGTLDVSVTLTGIVLESAAPDFTLLDGTVNFAPVSTPEPGTMFAGLVLLGLWWGRRRNQLRFNAG